jgi:hypothetical protein
MRVKMHGHARRHVTNRSRLSLTATLVWLLVLGAISTALSPGRVGDVGLLSLALIGARVLWNLDAVTAAWRQDRAAKRN